MRASSIATIISQVLLSSRPAAGRSPNSPTLLQTYIVLCKGLVFPGRVAAEYAVSACRDPASSLLPRSTGGNTTRSLATLTIPSGRRDKQTLRASYLPRTCRRGVRPSQ